MNRGAWRATVHRVAKSWTRLKQLSTHVLLCYLSASLDFLWSVFDITAIANEDCSRFLHGSLARWKWKALSYSWPQNVQPSDLLYTVLYMFFLVGREEGPLALTGLPVSWGGREGKGTKKTPAFSFLLILESYLEPYHFLCLRRQWHPTPVLLPGKSHGQRSLVGCSPWGR